MFPSESAVEEKCNVTMCNFEILLMNTIISIFNSFKSLAVDGTSPDRVTSTLRYEVQMQENCVEQVKKTLNCSLAPLIRHKPGLLNLRTNNMTLHIQITCSESQSQILHASNNPNFPH